MITRKVFQVHGDGGERGIGPVIGYASTKEKAEVMGKGKAWYGGNGYVATKFAVEIDGQLFILETPYPIDLDNTQATLDAELRKKTLAGLSAEQIRVLGIKP